MEEGYFNSFAVYLSEGKDDRFRFALKACRSLKEVKGLVGEEELEKALCSFDEINKRMIRGCQNEIEYTLKVKLLRDEYSLIDELKQWPLRFYWR